MNKDKHSVCLHVCVQFKYTILRAYKNDVVDKLLALDLFIIVEGMLNLSDILERKTSATAAAAVNPSPCDI